MEATGKPGFHYSYIFISLTTCVFVCKGGRQGVEDKVFTEEDWAADEGVSPYERSKKLAEKAAWELLEKLPGDNLLNHSKTPSLFKGTESCNFKRLRTKWS